MRKINLKNQRGFAPIIIAAIVVAVLIAGGATYYLVAKKTPAEKEAAKQMKEEQKASAEASKSEEAPAAVEEISVTAPEFDITSSLAALPKLNVSAINVAVPTLSSGDVFKSFFLDSDFSYKEKVDISAPAVEFTYTPTPAQSAPPAAPPSGGQAAGPASPAGEPPSSAGEQPAAEQPPASQGPTVSASDCAQFSSVPSCSYVGDPNGQSLCNQCKAAGY